MENDNENDDELLNELEELLRRCEMMERELDEIRKRWRDEDCKDKD